MADTVTREMVVDYVQPSPRKWDNPNGPALFFVTANFADGSEGSIGVTEDKVDETKAALEALKGTSTAFELESKGDFNGTPQWKLRGFPGKPSGGGGGGGRGGGGGMSHAQAGYMAAASVLGPILAAEGTTHPDALVASRVVAVGELITEALFSRKPPSQEETKEHHQATPLKDTITLPQLKQLKETLSASGVTTEEALASLGISALTELTKQQAEEAIQLFGS